MSNSLTDTSVLDDLEDQAAHQEEANRWYEDTFGGKERKKQIYSAWTNGGEESTKLQDEIYGFTHWATFHELQTKVYHLELATNCRLKVTTNLEGTVKSADFQYQGPSQPWTSAEDQDSYLLETYARIVGFYHE